MQILSDFFVKFFSVINVHFLLLLIEKKGICSRIRISFSYKVIFLK